ncbi:MAG: polyprenyl synthetase family protein, partial [Bacillota bacterium]|nr:polyprenyl synthetase family protein [Bacillota bacterium]
AEQKAEDYYQSLYRQVMENTYASFLTRDIKGWKHKHIRHHLLSSILLRKKIKPVPEDYQNYIRWLNFTGKLNNYLDRSISYILMRDLGKALDSPDTQDQVQRIAESLKSSLLHPTAAGHAGKTTDFNLAGLYRRAQKEGIESTVIWLVNKLKNVSANIPEGMNAEQAQRKLIKIIGGVIMHQLEEMDSNISNEERAVKLDEAIRLGYSYGLTYPFVDDLLDAKVLSEKEKEKYSDLIRTTLITGSVPELVQWNENNVDFIRYIHSELKEAFEYIKSHQRLEAVNPFLEQSYVFFNSQEKDREKEMSNAGYTNEELYIPIILKSSSSRLIARSVISAHEDEGFDSRTFFYSIYNQLADDFADMFDDMREGAVTPYTYYIKYHNKRSNLINPYELYWVVIFNLIHNVYHSDVRTCEVILDRAINGLKRFKERNGRKKYYEIMELFASGNSEFNFLVQRMVKRAEDVDFFDKLIRDHMIFILKNDNRERKEFLDAVETARREINNILNIHQPDESSLIKDKIIDAANYSLMGDGKRLRPIVTWIMAVKEYGLDRSAVEPLLRSLEYMHTASLIFDDLPSQDNAATRRGRSTLHQVYGTATAELTGIFLTQKAVEEQASLDRFDAGAVQDLIRYSAQVTEKVCRGQAMDLDSKGKTLTLEQLNTMCFYKTGIAFEASLIMPAILAHAEEEEINALKRFALHAGIAFQIKDDLLDVEGDPVLTGKAVGKDTENDNSTFVSILGTEGAKKEMWEHYCLAVEVLQEVPGNTSFLRHFLNYIVNREH